MTDVIRDASWSNCGQANGSPIDFDYITQVAHDKYCEFTAACLTQLADEPLAQLWGEYAQTPDSLDLMSGDYPDDCLAPVQAFTKENRDVLKASFDAAQNPGLLTDRYFRYEYGEAYGLSTAGQSACDGRILRTADHVISLLNKEDVKNLATYMVENPAFSVSACGMKLDEIQKLLPDYDRFYGQPRGFEGDSPEPLFKELCAFPESIYKEKTMALPEISQEEARADKAMAQAALALLDINPTQGQALVKAVSLYHLDIQAIGRDYRQAMAQDELKEVKDRDPYAAEKRLMICTGKNAADISDRQAKTLLHACGVECKNRIFKVHIDLVTPDHFGLGMTKEGRAALEEAMVKAPQNFDGLSLPLKLALHEAADLNWALLDKQVNTTQQTQTEAKKIGR